MACDRKHNITYFCYLIEQTIVNGTKLAKMEFETGYGPYPDHRYPSRAPAERYRRRREFEDSSVEQPRPTRERQLHEKLSISDSEDSSVDENWEVDSLAESIPDQLT